MYNNDDNSDKDHLTVWTVLQVRIKAEVIANDSESNVVCSDDDENSD